MREKNTCAPSTANKLMEFLNCPCQYFAPMLDDDPLMAAFHAAQERGTTEGFVPVLIAAEDDALLETLLMNSDPESDGAAFSSETVAAYRRAMCALPLPQDPAPFFQARHEGNEQENQEELEELIGDEGEPVDRFLGYWDFSTEKTIPLILAEIPAAHPWEIFSFLPFGGWNECPNTKELMTVAKYWFSQYGAAPAVITYDVLEFTLPQAAGADKAAALAAEQYAWCPDIVDQGVGSVSALAQSLESSTVWYFWWD